MPRLKTYLSVDWTYGPWGVYVAHNYQKGYNDIFASTEDPTVPGFMPRRVASYTTFDAQATYARRELRRMMRDEIDSGRATPADIARAFGVSRQRIRQMLTDPD